MQTGPWSTGIAAEEGFGLLSKLLVLQAPASKSSCDSCSALMFLVKESLVMEKENRRSCSISYYPVTDGAGPCITWCEGMEARSALLHR